MTHPATLLRELQGRARRRFGQHFLASPDVVEHIVALAGLAPGQRVLEIGPGLGVLTEALLAAQARVVAVELDRDLAAFLRERFAAPIAAGQLVVVEADAAKVDLDTLLEGEGWWCVANLPYNVGTHLLIRMLERPDRFVRLVLMLQREVAERLVAPPGGEARGSLSVFAQVRAEVRLALRVPPGAFYPPPKVASAVLTLDLRPAPELHGADPAGFDRTVRLSFSAPRKTMRRVLVDGLGVARAERALADANIASSARSGDLDAAALARLALALEEAPCP